MAVVVRNHVQPYRPLRGGIAIVNGNNGSLGTLGCVATADGADRWIVTAHHVMRGGGSVDIADDEPIFQPVFQPTQSGADPPVARTRRDRAVRALDVAAAKVVDGVQAVNEILGIGALGALAEPAVGMRVVKSGIATGVTEGTVVQVTGTEVRIQKVAGFPAKYELSAISDSGSVWVEEGSLSPVALHVAGADPGFETAIGVRMSAVLQALNLRLIG